MLTVGAAPYLAVFIALILLVRVMGTAWMPLAVGAALVGGAMLAKPDPVTHQQQIAAFALWCGVGGIVLGLIETVRVYVLKKREQLDEYRDIRGMFGGSIIVNAASAGLWIYSARWLMYDAPNFWPVWALPMVVGVVVFMYGVICWFGEGPRFVGGWARFLLGIPAAGLACVLLYYYASRMF